MRKRLLSFVLAVLMIASLLPATALAAGIVDSGTCGAEVTWTLDSEGVLTISGSGDMHDYSAPWYGSRSRVKSAVIADGVTSIGSSAFDGCKSLASVTIPDSVTRIGEWAFYDCESLTSVTIPDSVTRIGDGAFASCTSLTGIWVAEGSSHYSSDASGVLFNKGMHTLVQCPGAFAAYTIPDSVTSIGGSAFRGCASLTSVTIPDSVTCIGDWAFSRCESLTSVTIPDSVTSIGDCAFVSCTSLTGIWVAEGNSHYSSDASGVLFNKDMTTLVQCPGAFAAYTIPDSVTRIGEYAFAYCTSLTSVTIPGSVTRIGVGAFAYCKSLTSVTIPNSVTSIRKGAFQGCTSLTSVTIPDSVTSIGEWAFYDCESLTSVTIPDSVTSISKSAFSGCKSLTSVTIPDSVTSIVDGVFNGCTSLTNVTIPDSVTSIGDWAFFGCTSLTSVTIPDSVTSIGDGAFVSCTSLTGIWVAEGSSHYASDASGVLFNKGMHTLVQCPGAFAAYTIPDSVTSIGEYAFCGCKSLTSVTIPDSVTSIDWSAFSNCTSLTDVYYAGSEAQWKAISIVSDRNDDLLTANIHYNYVSHTHSYKDVVTAPTCTEKGYTTHTCACGDSYVDTYVDALGHAWDNGKVTKEPTETETGVKTFTCTRCGETKTETIPKLTHEHSYDAVVTAPTCTEKGYTTHTCACGDSYVDTYVDALGHAWDNGKVTKPATETEDGVKTFTCTRCGETKTETIPATGVMDVTKMFTDVSHSWADDGIQYCVTHQLMSGIGNNLFGPKLTTTRAQIVQILYNLEGEPKVSGTTPFTDLTQDWYQDAVLWAYQTGVVAGTSSTTFEPDRPVTREQIAVILMEYVTRVLKLERTWTPADLSIFPDADSVSDWAKDAMADAVGLGLISGASNGGQTYLEPQGSATREQVATILMEFCKNVKK